MKAESGNTKVHQYAPFYSLFWIGQILIWKCATRLSIETNENLIMTSQWKYIVTSLFLHVYQNMFMLVFEHYVGDDDKQLTQSYVDNHRMPGGGGGKMPPTL